MNKPTDYSDKTHALLRDLGIRCGKVERMIRGGGKIRKSDLFGVFDQVAVNLRFPYLPLGIIGIQDTGGRGMGNGNARVEKIRSDTLWPAVRDWILAGGHVIVGVWRWEPMGDRKAYHFRYCQIVNQTDEIEWKELGPK